MTIVEPEQVEDLLGDLGEYLNDPQAHIFCSHCFDIFNLPPGTVITAICGKKRLRRENLDLYTDICEMCLKLKNRGFCPQCGSTFKDWPV